MLRPIKFIVLMIICGVFVASSMAAGKSSGTGQHSTYVTNAIGMKLKLISKDTSSKAVYVGIYEVTQAQWFSLMHTNSSIQKGEDLPVEYVSFLEVEEFLKRLSKSTGDTYRLPTRTEWLKAYGGEENSRLQIDPDGIISVFETEDNSKGFYGMLDNVSEWCADWDKLNVPGWSNHRAIMGNNFLDGCKSSIRLSGGFTPDYRSNFLGFRVALQRNAGKQKNTSVR